VLAFIGMMLVTLGIFWMWFVSVSLLSHWRKNTGDCLVAAGVLLTTQVILSETVLGHFGWLTLPLVLVINLLAPAGILGFLSWRAPLNSGILSGHRRLWIRIPLWWKEVRGWENYIAFVLLGFLVLWIGTADYLLPPRVFDDAYHLPPAFDS